MLCRSDKPSIAIIAIQFVEAKDPRDTRCVTRHTCVHYYTVITNIILNSLLYP